MANKEKVIRVGSRKSELALIQTKYVISRLQQMYPLQKFEIHTMTTIGDRVLNISLPKIGEKSLFTRDLEDALRNGGIDLIVHSLKDLPTSLPIGMTIGAVLEREDERDALVLKESYTNYTIGTLPAGSVIGTSSLRRTAQIKRQYPHLVVCDIRGNLNTRLAKLDAPDSKFAGIILAQAGLLRMGWNKRISQVLEPTDLLYAVGQGALAVECRANDVEILNMLQRLVCLPTSCRVLAERSFLKTLGGGCSAPVAVCSKLNGDIVKKTGEVTQLTLDGAVWSLDGITEIREKITCSLKLKKNEIALKNDRKMNDNSMDEPVNKRKRNSISRNQEMQDQGNPAIIDDDAEVESLSSSYSINDLVEKHMVLAQKCPIMSLGKTEKSNIESHEENEDVTNKNVCPLQMNIGQDFMGQCPFVTNTEKVSLASADKCSIKNSNNQADNVIPSTSKCPFTSLHYLNKSDCIGSKIEPTHAKCPFLQKTVKMIDYGDEEKPLPRKLGHIEMEDIDDLFCGLYQHSCYDRNLYVMSNKLGQQLAEELIKNGALDVMKCAQAEIHSKA